PLLRRVLFPSQGDLPYLKEGGIRQRRPQAPVQGSQDFSESTRHAPQVGQGQALERRFVVCGRSRQRLGQFLGNTSDLSQVFGFGRGDRVRGSRRFDAVTGHEGSG